MLRGPDGKVIPYLGDTFPYGTTALTSTHSTSEGVQLQATNKDKYFGHDNYFVVGGSIDHGDAHFNSHTLIGELNSQFQNITSGVNFPGAASQRRRRANSDTARSTSPRRPRTMAYSRSTLSISPGISRSPAVRVLTWQTSAFRT